MMLTSMSQSSFDMTLVSVKESYCVWYLGLNLQMSIKENGVLRCDVLI